MRKHIKNCLRLAITPVVAALALGACDILEVTDPQRYTSADLDSALPAIANGVEGAVHEVQDTWVVYQALLSDVYQHTGTWSGYDETDHGRFQYGTSPMDGTMNSLLRARWFAGDAEERFEKVLEGAAGTSPLTAQVQMSGAMADLMIGLAYCEAPGDNDGVAVSDQQILAQAISKFSTAISTGQSAGTPDYVTASYAGRATAKLVTGDYAGAAADAAMVPAGFSYDAVFNQASNNWVVTVTTKNFNEAGGLMHKWWPQIEQSDDPGFFRDPVTGDWDTRMPVYFDGEVATDNETPHYSQWKYTKESDPIPMLHSDGMQLIIAENHMRNNDFAAATGILNNLRAAVGLGPHATPTDMAGMQDILLWERFAEHFMEGMRQVDLHRFGLVRSVFDALNDPERVGGGRPTQFSMTDTESTYNANIDNDLAQRCLPTA